MEQHTHEEIHEEHPVDQKLEAGKRVETVGRVLATIGLIILLVLGAWGIIILAFNAPDFFSSIQGGFSSIFGTATSTPATSTPSSSSGQTLSAPETLTVSAAASSVASGQTIQLSWNDQNAATARGFLISYACSTGLTMDALLPNQTYRAVPCATPFNYTNAQSGAALRVHLTGTTPEPAVITVSAISLETGTTTASGSTSVTVTPVTTQSSSATKTTTASKTAVSTKTTYTSYRSNSGAPDLAVSVIEVGYVNPANGAIVPLSAAYAQGNGAQYGTMAIEFNIQNIGSNTAPAGWQFTANIPSLTNASAPSTYTSAPQGALTPGSGIIFTMHVTMPNSQSNCAYQNYPYGNEAQYCTPTYQSYSTQPITITVDPAHIVHDYNWSNNVAQTTL